ncbi:MAG TPA: hypothetical protein PKA41_07180 [Verrucomicrobiota bacterium]|nr:hypothetical protein [Verrucomicrobiota bacterium]
MNTVEMTDTIPQRHQNESTAIASPAKSPRAASATIARDRLYRALLLCIVLMVVWMTYNVHSSLNTIDNELEMIRSNLLLPR